MTDNIILGRNYTAVSRRHKGKEISPRYMVEGVYHLGQRAKGGPKVVKSPNLIQFKTLKRAENHIRTMGLAR